MEIPLVEINICFAQLIKRICNQSLFPLNQFYNNTTKMVRSSGRLVNENNQKWKFDNVPNQHLVDIDIFQYFFSPSYLIIATSLS